MTTPRTYRIPPDAIRVLKALKGWRNGPPTLAELGAKLGMSTSSVGYHLTRLEEVGMARREKGRWRSWEAVK